MAPSTSSGRVSNKDAIPYEQRGRMLWDPAYRAKYGDQGTSSESDDEDTHDNDEYPMGTYVSGGLQAGQRAQSSTSARPNAFTAVPGKEGSANDRAVDKDGFQRVQNRPPYKRRLPRRMQFGVKRDNAAKAAFRKRELPNGRFDLPRDCNEIEPDRAKMYDYLEEMGVRLGSFIRPPQLIRDRTLMIWGSKDQVALTRDELYNWLNPSPEKIGSKSKAKDNFADIYSTAGDRYKRLQKKFQQDADIRKFQQDPAAGTVFEFTGSFLWPANEIAPTDLLGAGLEALDPIRLKLRCHITFDSRLSAFRILTNDMESVKETIARIQGIMKEYVARSNRPTVRYYIEPPGPSEYRKEIRKVLFEPGIHTSAPPVVPLMTGKGLEPDPQNRWLRQSGDLKAQSDRGIEDALRKTIPNLRFYRGRVRMRVYFGTFALTSFSWPGTVASIALEDFMKRMAVSGTKGVMIRDLQFKSDAAFVIEKIHNAGNLFQPIDNQAMSLADVLPTFSAYFECQDGDRPSVKLEVEKVVNATDQNLYDETHALWARLGRSDNTAPLDIFMMSLVGGPSWNLKVSTENTIDPSRITPKMVRFAKSVKMKSRGDKVELTGEPVFEWDKTGCSMRVLAFQQKTSLRFRLLRNMEYVIEISRYDTYDNPVDINQMTKAQMKQPASKRNSSQKTNWGATLWNTDWDSELIANTRLGIGESAKWDPRLATFFPNQTRASTKEGAVSEGVMEFLQIVNDVNSFLWDIRKGQ